MRRGLGLLSFYAVTGLALGGQAQDACPPGDEFCLPPPPCYREPDNPDCNPDCTCNAPDYPECDPYCAPGDICDPNCANPCWDEFDGDVCSDPPPVCEPTGDLPFEFRDDTDGNDDGQIFAVHRPGQDQGCGTIRVDTTGYYAIFDTELSESCDDQLDETGYLTVENSCNSRGWAVERNAGERFLVLDSDNSPDCTGEAQCDPGEVCREGNSHGRCCVPEAPVFMGTFLLVAGEDNRICINHWCPEWEAEIEAGNDFGFVVNGCEGVNSIHFRIGTTAIACEDETTLQLCSWGCMDGTCLPDPCEEMSCPAYCMDGVCLDENPCENVTCEHGCVRGRCLQNRHARGPDVDEDGFADVADCDDADPTVNPDRREVCGNALDDDCDGTTDEADCDGERGDADGGSARDAGPWSDGGELVGDGSDGAGATGGGDGCGCRVAPSKGAALPATLLGLAALWLMTWRRRSRRSSY